MLDQNHVQNEARQDSNSALDMNTLEQVVGGLGYPTFYFVLAEEDQSVPVGRPEDVQHPFGH